MDPYTDGKAGGRDNREGRTLISKAERRVVVVRDREERALRNPPPDVFDDVTEVLYVHAPDAGSLPSAGHYVFNCVRLDDRLRTLLSNVAERGVCVTAIVEDLDAELVLALERLGINLIPSYGTAGRISAETFRKSIARAHGGTRVWPAGLVHHSVGVPVPTARGHALLDLLSEASAVRPPVTAVAAVIALQRSGSKVLRDLVGLTMGSHVGVLHEHQTITLSEIGLDSQRPEFDQIALVGDAKQRQRLKRMFVAHKISDADRRYIFVPERRPEARLFSHFLVRHRVWLRESYDAVRGAFADVSLIQRVFDDWVSEEVRRQGSWYRRNLLEPLGLDILKTSPDTDGLFVGRHGANTLVVVPTDRLTDLRARLELEFGAESYASVSDNSTSTRGDSQIGKALADSVRLCDSAAAGLRAIPEVAHIHGVSSTDQMPR